MNLLFQRTVDHYLGSFLCRVFSLFPNRHRHVLPEPHRILVILLSEMGSLVLAYPMMKYVSERYPNAQLYALVFKKNREVLELLEIIEKGNILTIRDDSFTVFFRDSIGAIRKLRDNPVDAVIDCELFARISSLFSFLSGAPIKAGFHRHTQEGLYRGDFINRPVPYNPYLHISKQFLNLAYALETNTVPNAKHLFPYESLVITPKRFPIVEIEGYSAKLYSDFPRFQERRIVLVYPSGGILPIRAWPSDYFCQLCKGLTEEELSVGIIGLPSDQYLGQKIVDFADSEYCINLMGYTQTMRELFLLLLQSSLLVTNDGGPGQFAALLDVPSIIFFGPESPHLYAPLSSNSYCFYRQLACSPCLTAYNHRNSPCNGDNQCLKGITVQEVLNKTREILAPAYSNSVRETNF